MYCNSSYNMHYHHADSFNYTKIVPVRMFTKPCVIKAHECNYSTLVRKYLGRFIFFRFPIVSTPEIACILRRMNVQGQIA